MVEVRWTDQALDDLGAICQFIARDSPHIAEVFDRPDVREIFVYAYRIMYLVSAVQVQILTVHHGARLLKDLDLAD